MPPTRAGHLASLLATIHRDGGRYLDDYGYERAVDDARKIVERLWMIHDEHIEPAVAFLTRYADGLHFAGRLGDERALREAIKALRGKAP